MDFFEHLREDRNTNNRYANDAGIRITKISEGHAEAVVDLDERHQNIIGSVHGGVYFTLADSTAGCVAASYGSYCTTVNSSIQYLSAAIGNRQLIAVADAIKHGKKLTVIDVRISDETGRLLVQATMTFMSLEKPIIYQD